MVNLFLVIPITIGVSIVGLGLGYWIYTATRPKKMTWNAKVYQLGEGVIPPQKDNKGNIISNIQLRDLRPYTLDILERVEKDKGITIYRLVKLNRTTPQVTGDCIEFWGRDIKPEVSVLLEQESCTLLKKGYDRSGIKVFRPLAYDRVNMVKNEIAIRTERLNKEKDILQALAPYVVIAVSMVALIGIAFLVIKGLTEMSKTQKEMMSETNAALVKVSENYNAWLTSQSPKVTPLTQPTQIEPPPSIDPG